MAEVNYKVTLPFTFLADSRTRGGITVPREGGYEGTLSAEALKEIKADKVLTVEKIVDVVAEAKAKAVADTANKAN